MFDVINVVRDGLKKDCHLVSCVWTYPLLYSCIFVQDIGFLEWNVDYANSFGALFSTL